MGTSRVINTMGGAGGTGLPESWRDVETGMAMEDIARHAAVEKAFDTEVGGNLNVFPIEFPAGVQYQSSFSGNIHNNDPRYFPDGGIPGSYFAVGQATAPYISIYKTRENAQTPTRFVKLSSPFQDNGAAGPTSVVQGCAFFQRHDWDEGKTSLYLVLGCTASPFMYVYKKDPDIPERRRSAGEAGKSGRAANRYG